jgi:hypothetical protein
MEYMLILNSDENFEMPAPGSAEFEAFMGEWMAYNQTLIEGGHWISGASLAPTSTATTLHKTFDGSRRLTDGPYAETKEQFGGYYLIEAKDLDEALRLAEAVPIPQCSIEVRPVAFRPDAG